MPYQPAVLGPNTRLNNFRLAYLPEAVVPIRETRVGIWIDGILSTSRVRLYTLTIHDILNDAPNTCQFVLEGSPPPVSGMALRITINSNTPRLLFNGTIQVEGETFEGKPDQVAYPCAGIDDTARVNYSRPFGHWQDVSASTVATDLIAEFAPGFTVDHVEAGLPDITITFDGTEALTGCLRQIVKLIGGYFYVEDLDLHLFLTEATDAPDDLDDTPDRFLHAPAIAYTSDDSQLRTRVYGRGHAETTLADLDAGETVIPIADAVMFNPGGGRAIASTTPDGAASERLTYTGTVLAEGGAIVGPGAAPGVALTVAAKAGAGLSTGTYTYAYTYVTAAGESVPGPVATVVTGAAVANPTAPITLMSYANAGAAVYPFAVGDAIRYWAYTFVTAAGETLPSALYAVVTSYPLGGFLPYTMRATIPTGPPGTIARKIYRTPQSATTPLKLAGTLANNTPGQFQDETLDASLGATAPTVSTAGTASQVAITGIAVGPSGTTARKVYRGAVNTTILKLQQTIANNTATVGVDDTTPDGSLGATAPASDTSGFAQPFGQVNAGSTSIVVSSTAPFPVPGWVLTTAGDVVRYSGVSGNTLTGIPASGAGAILTTVYYNDPLLPAPSLTGVDGLVNPILRGAPVYLWVQRDDFAAQTAAADRESTDLFTSTGVHEHVLVDERRGEESLAALCDADLALFADPLVTVTYATRDVKTRSGKPIVVDLTTPAIHETLTIQDVTITEIDTVPGLAPRFMATASSVRFSLEDTLRQLSGLVEV